MSAVDPSGPEITGPPRRRALVNTEVPPRRRAPDPAPYNVKANPVVPRLQRRPWRGAKVALAIVLLVAFGIFAAVQGLRTFAEVIETEDDFAGLDDYVDGRGGVEVVEEDPGFRAEFPVTPTRNVVGILGSDTNEVASALEAEAEGGDFSILWYEIDEAVDDPAAALSYLAGVTAIELDGELEGQSMLASSAIPAHQFAVNREDGTDLFRHLLVDRTLYEIRVSAAQPLTGAFTRFADSFEPFGASAS